MPSRILIVDDDPLICELIQEVLSSVEMESFSLTNSSQALAHLSREKFGAVFLDVRMPSPDGIELTQQIRTRGLNRTTPIVIVTGDEDCTVLSRAFKAGASFFLFKPVDRHCILRLIRITEDCIQREARRFERVRIRCKVSLESGQEQLSGWTLDLSLGGLFVQASRTLSVGSTARVSVELKSGTPRLCLTTRVVRVPGDNCMGLQIEKAGPRETKRLQEFLLPLILGEMN
jgi:PleD family two-component response regulator